MIRYLGTVASIVAVFVQFMFTSYSYGNDAYVLYGSSSSPMESGRYTSCNTVDVLMFWYTLNYEPSNVYVYFFQSSETPIELWTEMTSVQNEFCNSRYCAFRVGLGGKLGASRQDYSYAPGILERTTWTSHLKLCVKQDGSKWMYFDTDESRLGVALARRYPDKCVSHHYRGDHTNHCIVELPLR